MTHEIEISIMSVKIENGHLPSTWKFTADIAPSGQGIFGLPADDSMLPSAAVVVNLPDWVVISDGHMTRPGYTSKCGTANRCFVTCNIPATESCKYYGACDYHALIMRAFESGLTLHYPDADRSMVSEPINGDLIGWRENGSRVIKPI